MPVEDWIEKWTDAQVREMTTLAENQKRTTDALGASLQRMEDRHEARMERIEDSITEVKRLNTEEFNKLYEKIETMNTTLNEFIRITNEKSSERDNEHAITLAELKTKMAAIIGTVGLVAGAFISWLFGLIHV